MDLMTLDDLMKFKANYVISELSKTRQQEIAIIGLLIIAIGIGITILINQRKIKKQLRELLDQKEDKPNGESSETTTE